MYVLSSARAPSTSIYPGDATAIRHTTVKVADLHFALQMKPMSQYESQLRSNEDWPARGDGGRVIWPLMQTGSTDLH